MASVNLLYMNAVWGYFQNDARRLYSVSIMNLRYHQRHLMRNQIVECQSISKEHRPKASSDVQANDQVKDVWQPCFSNTQDIIYPCNTRELHAVVFEIGAFFFLF